MQDAHAAKRRNGGSNAPWTMREKKKPANSRCRRSLPRLSRGEDKKEFVRSIPNATQNYYPSITAAIVVQVSPIAIPIQGVCPNVPSLRLVNSVDDRGVRRESAVLWRSGRDSMSSFVWVSATCRWNICCASEGICGSSSGCVCTSGKCLDGEPFGSDGLGATACGDSAATMAIVGARQNINVEGFIVRVELLRYEKLTNARRKRGLIGGCDGWSISARFWSR